MRLLRIPVILHVHNPLDVATRNLDRFAATRVIFVSEAHRRATGRLDRIEARSLVLHNPVDLERLAAGRDIRRALGLAPSNVVVATVCQITPNKALDVLLEVARSPSISWQSRSSFRLSSCHSSCFDHARSPPREATWLKVPMIP